MNEVAFNEREEERSGGDLGEAMRDDGGDGRVDVFF